MVTDQTAQSEILNFGSLKKAVGPSTWTKSLKGGGIENRSAETLHPPEDGEVQISAFSNGRPIDENVANVFSLMLSAQVGAPANRDLTAEEIKSLRMVMGFSTVGNNQYTNPSTKGTRDFAVFNLTSAALVTINGRTVLRCRGNFQNESGVPGTEYDGLIFSARGNNAIVEELFFQAPTRGKFLRFAPEWEKALKTVEWN